VHEELGPPPALIFSYQALTAFWPAFKEIGQEEKETGRAGTHSNRARRCSTTPRRTSSTWVVKERRRAKRPSLVLCYSRMVFFQFYSQLHPPFHCKVFLTDALHYLGGRLYHLHDRQHAPGGAPGDPDAIMVPRPGDASPSANATTSRSKPMRKGMPIVPLALETKVLLH